MYLDERRLANLVKCLLQIREWKRGGNPCNCAPSKEGGKIKQLELYQCEAPESKMPRLVLSVKTPASATQGSSHKGTILRLDVKVDLKAKAETTNWMEKEDLFS